MENNQSSAMKNLKQPIRRPLQEGRQAIQQQAIKDEPMATQQGGAIMPFKTTGNDTYVSTSDWSQPVPFNPNDPSSPFSAPIKSRRYDHTMSAARLGAVSPTAVDSARTQQGMQPMQQSIPQVQQPVGDIAALPPTLTERIYTPGYLREHIGDIMRVDFLIGNNITDRVGVLTEVGASYIILQALDFGSLILCDIYSIKFVTIINNEAVRDLYASFQ